LLWLFYAKIEQILFIILERVNYPGVGRNIIAEATITNQTNNNSIFSHFQVSGQTFCTQRRTYTNSSILYQIAYI